MSRTKGKQEAEWERWKHHWKHHRKKEQKGFRIFKQHPKEARGGKKGGGGGQQGVGWIPDRTGPKKDWGGGSQGPNLQRSNPEENYKMPENLNSFKYSGNQEQYALYGTHYIFSKWYVNNYHRVHQGKNIMSNHS